MSHFPTRQQAELLLLEAEPLNIGNWGTHSRIAGKCAEAIALAVNRHQEEQVLSGQIPDTAKVTLDPDKAYVVGLLHDIGRRFGRGHMQHIRDGYRYMMFMGYPEVARICLTHSFNLPTFADYIGKHDILPEEEAALEAELKSLTYDDYDRLIQLCDSIAGGEGIMDQTARMQDVKDRYGMYPQEKWDQNLYLRRYFETLAGRDLYDMLREVQQEFAGNLYCTDR